jgi:hypothetical protein
VVLAGNKKLAESSLEEIVLEAAKSTFAPGFSWQYASEIKMLSVLTDKTQNVVRKVTASFVDLPNVNEWRNVTQKGDTKFPSDEISSIALDEFSSLWESQHRHAQRKLKTFRNELFKSFNLLENKWRQRDYECSPKKKKTAKTRRKGTRRNGTDSNNDRRS